LAGLPIAWARDGPAGCVAVSHKTLHPAWVAGWEKAGRKELQGDLHELQLLNAVMVLLRDTGEDAAHDWIRFVARRAPFAGTWQPGRGWLSIGSPRWLCWTALRKTATTWGPLLPAWEAGLWMYFIATDSVVLVPRPSLRVQNRRLHCDTGPAISWPTPKAARFFAWKGILGIPWHAIEAPGLITVEDILNERNQEIRHVLAERYGVPRFLSEAHAELLHQDRFGTLYRVNFPLDEPLVMVKVVNGTPEADGTRKAYFLRVPPTTRTAHEAVSWTFGLTDGYAPLVET